MSILMNNSAKQSKPKSLLRYNTSSFSKWNGTGSMSKEVSKEEASKSENKPFQPPQFIMEKLSTTMTRPMAPIQSSLFKQIT